MENTKGMESDSKDENGKLICDGDYLYLNRPYAQNYFHFASVHEPEHKVYHIVKVMWDWECSGFILLPLSSPDCSGEDNPTHMPEDNGSFSMVEIPVDESFVIPKEDYDKYPAIAMYEDYHESIDLVMEEIVENTIEYHKNNPFPTEIFGELVDDPRN